MLQLKDLSFRQSWFVWLFAIFSIILAIADATTTEFLLARGGIEGNPVVAWMMKTMGIWWIVPKMIACTSISLFVLACWKSRLAKITMAIYIIMYGTIVIRHCWFMVKL